MGLKYFTLYAVSIKGALTLPTYTNIHIINILLIFDNFKINDEKSIYDKIE